MYSPRTETAGGLVTEALTPTVYHDLPDQRASITFNQRLVKRLAFGRDEQQNRDFCPTPFETIVQCFGSVPARVPIHTCSESEGCYRFRGSHSYSLINPRSSRRYPFGSNASACST